MANVVFRDKRGAVAFMLLASVLMLAVMQPESEANADVGERSVDAPIESLTQRDACDFGYCALEGSAESESGTQCCSVSDRRCHATDSVCSSEEITVWCDQGERARMRVHGDWICSPT